MPEMTVCDPDSGISGLEFETSGEVAVCAIGYAFLRLLKMNCRGWVRRFDGGDDSREARLLSADHNRSGI
jgi:hypothetical protein